MSQYDPNDPLWRGPAYEPATRGKNSGWAWIAAAVIVVALIAVAVGFRHQAPVQTASNDMVGRPAPNHLAPQPPQPLGAPSAPSHVSPGGVGLAPPPAAQPSAPAR
jgi:hypothetical protein